MLQRHPWDLTDKEIKAQKLNDFPKVTDSKQNSGLLKPIVLKISLALHALSGFHPWWTTPANTSSICAMLQFSNFSKVSPSGGRTNFGERRISKSSDNSKFLSSTWAHRNITMLKTVTKSIQSWEDGLNLSRNEIIYVKIFIRWLQNGYVPWGFPVFLYQSNSKTCLAFSCSLSPVPIKMFFYSLYLA